MALHRIAFATGVLVLGLCTSLFTNLWLIRAVAAEVAINDLGLLLTVTSYVSYFGFLQLGLDQVSAQRIAEAQGRGDFDAASRAYYQLRWFNAALAGLLLLATAVVSVPIGARSGVMSGWIVGASGLGLVLNVLTTPAVAALTGTQSLHLVSVVRLMGTFCST